MTRPLACLRLSTALLRHGRKQAFRPQSRGLRAKAAPAIKRHQGSRLKELEDQARHIPQDPTPLDDAAIMNRLVFAREQDPALIGSIERALASIMDPQAVPRMILFTIANLFGLGRAERWSDRVQANFHSRIRLYSVSVGHAHEAARQLLKFRSNSYMVSNTGLLMLQCCSRTGYEEATLDLGISYKDYAQSGNGVVTEADYLQAKQEVQKLADKGSVRAASLLAELVQQNSGPRAAVKYWENAVSIASGQDSPTGSGSSRFNHLEQPWISLAAVKSSALNDQAGANAALRVGMLKDDPDAYYIFAIQNTSNRSQDPKDHLEWINAVTKSAASGSFRSAIELGHHYANDLPVDLSQFKRPNVSSSWWTDLVSWTKSGYNRIFGATQDGGNHQEGSSGEDTELNQYQFQVAAYASAAQTPRDRMHLAIKWLEIAAEQGSVAARLDLAVLRSRKFIFQAMNLELAIKRPDEQRDTDINEYLERQFGYPAELVEGEQPVAPGSDLVASAEIKPPKEFVWRKGIENPFFDLDKVADNLAGVIRFKSAKRALDKNKGTLVDDHKHEVAPEFYTFPDLAELNDENSEANHQAAMEMTEELRLTQSVLQFINKGRRRRTPL